MSQGRSRRTLIFVSASALVATMIAGLAPSASAGVGGVAATATVASCSANAVVYTNVALVAIGDTVAVTFNSNCNGATVTAANFSGGTSPVGSGGPTYTYTATATPASGTLITIVKAGKTVTIVNFGGSSPTEVSKVTICHRTRATTNPYVLITVSVNSVIGSGAATATVITTRRERIRSTRRRTA